MQRRTFLSGALTLGAGAIAPAYAQADQWPSRAIKLLDAYAPGSASDTILRLVAPHLTTGLGQPCVVENRPGAGGNLAAKYAAQQPPDGYTLLMATNTMLAANPWLFPSGNIDTERDFSYVTPACSIGMILVGGPATPSTRLQDLLALSKDKPQSVAYGTPGIGSPMHLIAESLAQRTSSQLLHVPYKGGAPIITDVLAGTLAIGVVAYAVVAGQLKQGRLKPIAVTGNRRLSALPEVPALGELYPGVDLSAWCAIVAPRNTPEAIRQRAADEIRRALARPEVVAPLRENGLEPIGGNEATLAAMVRSESAMSRDLIAKLGIRLD